MYAWTAMVAMCAVTHYIASMLRACVSRYVRMCMCACMRMCGGKKHKSALWYFLI